MIKNTTKKLNNAVFANYFPLFSLLLFLLAFSLPYQGILGTGLFSLLSIMVLFSISTFLISKFKKIFPVMDLGLLLLVFIFSFIDKSLLLSSTMYGLIQPLMFAVFGFLLLRIYEIKLDFKFNNFKKIAIILGISLLFAYLFLLLNEPFPAFIKGQLAILILYTLFVSLGEELVFRGVSFSLVKRVFSPEKSIHVQALIFTVIHLLSIVTLYNFYELKGSLLLSGSFAFVNVLIYAVALYGFAVVAARYATSNKNTNIVYPVYFHWLVNFLNLVVLLV